MFLLGECFWGSALRLAQLDAARSEVRKMLADIGKEPLSFARDFLPQILVFPGPISAHQL